MLLKVFVCSNLGIFFYICCLIDDISLVVHVQTTPVLIWPHQMSQQMNRMIFFLFIFGEWCFSLFLGLIAADWCPDTRVKWRRRMWVPCSTVAEPALLPHYLYYYCLCVFSTSYLHKTSSVHLLPLGLDLSKVCLCSWGWCVIWEQTQVEKPVFFFPSMGKK